MPRQAVVGDDDADEADRDDFLVDQLDRREPAVDEIGAVGQRRILPTAAAAGPQEGFRVLIVVVEIGIVFAQADRRAR